MSPDTQNLKSKAKDLIKQWETAKYGGRRVPKDMLVDFLQWFLKSKHAVPLVFTNLYHKDQITVTEFIIKMKTCAILSTKGEELESNIEFEFNKSFTADNAIYAQDWVLAAPHEIMEAFQSSRPQKAAFAKEEIDEILRKATTLPTGNPIGGEIPLTKQYPTPWNPFPWATDMKWVAPKTEITSKFDSETLSRLDAYTGGHLQEWVDAMIDKVVF